MQAKLFAKKEKKKKVFSSAQQLKNKKTEPFWQMFWLRNLWFTLKSGSFNQQPQEEKQQ